MKSMREQAPARNLSPAAESSFEHDFSRVPVHCSAPVKIQAKFTASTGDLYEQEADDVARRVLQMPASHYDALGQNEPHDLQAHRNWAIDPEKAIVPPIVHKGLQSTGKPIDPTTREFMESRFGHDFSKVTVHTDALASDAASALAARAFTVGSDIVFGPGEYAPQTDSGRWLLSHELTHVVQQQTISTVNPIGNTPIQRKLVDQAGREIKINLEGVKPGDSVTPEFPEKSNRRAREDTTRIVNAMLKTPSGLRALETWIEMPESIRLDYTEKLLFGEDGEEAHGLSQPAKKGVTEVSVSGATLSNKSDRYRHLKGEQLWGAVAVHESVHQSKENLDLKKRHDKLLDKIDQAGNRINKDDLKQAKALALEKEVEPIRLELTSLIEYDVLYPEKAGDWQTRNFEKRLGKDIYRETVNSAIEGLVLGGYLDATQKSQVLDLYLLHSRRAPRGKGTGSR